MMGWLYVEPVRLGWRGVWRRPFLASPAPFPAEAVPPILTRRAVRASSGQPFWLLVWRLRGLRDGRLGSSPWERLRLGAAGPLLCPGWCLLRWRRPGGGPAWAFYRLSGRSPAFPTWRVWPPPPDSVRARPLTAALLAGAATRYGGLRPTWEVFISRRPLASPFWTGSAAWITYILLRSSWTTDWLSDASGSGVFPMRVATLHHSPSFTPNSQTRLLVWFSWNDQDKNINFK